MARRLRSSSPRCAHPPCRAALLYLWAAPTSAVGLLVLTLAAIFGRRARHAIVEGVLEVHGGFVSWLLEHATLLPGGASAMTLGHVVLARDARLLTLTRDHERIHVRQCERWGPLFIPAYVLASAAVWIRGGHAYRDNPFEREAYDAAAL